MSRKKVCPLSFVKSVAFWLLVLSCIICVCDGIGSGLANLWIRLTPPISLLLKLDFMDPVLLDRMNTTKWPGSSALLPVSFLTYVIYVTVYWLFGLAMNGLIRNLGRLRSERRGK